jgi:hypothetical protein
MTNLWSSQLAGSLTTLTIVWIILFENDLRTLTFMWISKLAGSLTTLLIVWISQFADGL